jgi:hypothetical protein
VGGRNAQWVLAAGRRAARTSIPATVTDLIKHRLMAPEPSNQVGRFGWSFFLAFHVTNRARQERRFLQKTPALDFCPLP